MDDAIRIVMGTVDGGPQRPGGTSGSISWARLADLLAGTREIRPSERVVQFEASVGGITYYVEPRPGGTGHARDAHPHARGSPRSATDPAMADAEPAPRPTG